MRWCWWVVLGLGAAGARGQALVLPSAVAYDAVGDLYFADTNRQQVFEVSLAGVLTVVAGTGVQGFGGDGGSAMGAELSSPQGVAVGTDGTVYVADTGNHRVRAVVGGVISTFAGTGVAGFGGDGGAATAGMLRGPTALAMDGTGALLICDTGNERVRRVSGGVIATVVGSGVQGFAGDGGLATAAELDSPMGVAVDGAGRVFVADSHNARVRVVVGGVITTLAGTGVAGFGGDGGAATSAELSLPRGLAVDSAGDLVIADANNQRIRMVTAGGVIETIAGSGVQGVSGDGVVAVKGMLNTPRGVGISGMGQVGFVDSPNRLVREVAANGEIYTVAVVSPVRVSGVLLTAGTEVYGDGSVGVSVRGSGPVPMGVVTVIDGASSVGSVTLKGGVGSLGLGMMGVGVHGLMASYAGDGVNPAAVSAVTQVQVVRAPVVVGMQAGGGYVGTPMVMTATVGAVYAGAPTGVVSFLDGGSVVATGTVVNGVAGGTYLSPGVGSHAMSASYAGDANFVGGVSGGVTAVVAGMPDFSMTAGVGSVTVQGGLVASYPLQVASVGGNFSGVVSFAVSGLQKGAVATFSPVAVVPGSTGAAVVMSVATVANAASGVGWMMAGVVVVMGLGKKWRKGAGMVVLMGLCGCGARAVSESVAGSKSYAMTVTATSTNLAGVVVLHTTQVELVVE